jgi:hypothetical protein
VHIGRLSTQKTVGEAISSRWWIARTLSAMSDKENK